MRLVLDKDVDTSNVLIEHHQAIFQPLSKVSTFSRAITNDFLGRIYDAPV
jgi:hypothetical protein